MNISRYARRWSALAPALALALALLPAPAHAYLDPGTGSMILSAIIGLFAPAALAIKTWWYRIKSLFRRQDPAGRPASANPAQPADEHKPAGGQ
jgi:hypothetical protein